MVVPMTSNQKALRFDHCFLVNKSSANGLTMDSVALIPQLRAIDKGRLLALAGTIEEQYLGKIEDEIKQMLAL